MTAFPTVWVLGLGTVGAELAALFTQHGHQVIGIEADPAALARATERIPAVAGKFDLTVDPAGAPAPDLVIEALPEQAEIKLAMLRRVNELCGPDTVFATTTAGLSVTELALESGRLTRTVGLQPGAKVLELVCTPVTEEPVRQAMIGLISALGRTPVLVSDHPGFIGGSLLLRYLNRSAALCEEGYASPAEVDVAMTLGCGLKIGPMAQLDRMGLDVAAAGLRALAERTGDRSFTPAPILDRLVEQGRLGRKSGRGFHNYESTVDDTPPAPAAKARSVRRIGVVGSGTMATGVAEVTAAAGYDTVLVARTDLRAKQVTAAVESSLDRRVRKGKLTAEQLSATMDRLVCTTELAALADCDLVIEAVAEDLAVKQAVFAELDRVARPGAVLATITSSLSVTDCAAATSRPQDVIGLHFFNPAPVMRLVEVVHTRSSAPEAVATGVSLATALGKRPVCCGDRAGFVVNRLLLPYLNDAVALAHRQHLDIADVDQVMAGGHGFPLGPFQLQDMIGLDVCLATVIRLHEVFRDPGLSPAEPLRQLVAAGHLGRKTGRGFYPHEPA
ncbi:3-hydroxyacyl-CoA dehydrogenase family protein [Crossiella sp. NPDC003009]